MKKYKTSLIIYYLFICNCCLGQYNPIFDHNHSMIMTYKFSNLFGTTSDTLAFQKDTLIDEIIYMKFTDGFFMGNYYFREEASTGIVSYFSDADPTEKIIIDFSLELGDDFFVEGAWLANSGYYQVDSVYYEEGRKHIQLNLPLYYAGDEKLTFIEGIGTNIGLTYKDSPSVNINPYLLCLWKDDDLVYSNIYYDGQCSINGGTIIKNEDVDYFNIYPNPAYEFISIEINDKLNSDYFLIEIINSKGERVYFERKFKPYIKIYLSDLTAGLYIVIIKVNNVTYQEKLIIRL
jgi:hypothetical protein